MINLQLVIQKNKFNVLSSRCPFKEKRAQQCLPRFPLRTRGHHFGTCESLGSSPSSIYQYSNMALRLSGQNCKFFKFLLSLNSQKRLEYKENNTKYRSLTRKPWSHVRILIYRTWPLVPGILWPFNLLQLVYFQRKVNTFNYMSQAASVCRDDSLPSIT